MTLTEFLLARIAEEQGLAITAHWGDCDMFSWDLRCTCDLPARVLAECTAKRTIIDQCMFVDDRQDDYAVGLRDDVLRSLAAVYANHRDYQQEWAS